MQNIGYITLNISLIIYFVHFIPQTIHNQFKHTTSNISLWTHSFMILANSLDLIYAVGWGLQWQYICVDVTLLSFLFIQQIQILVDIKTKQIKYHTLMIIIFIILCLITLFFIKNINKEILLGFGTLSGVVYNIYWLPQIYKNFKEKTAEGFSIYYLILSFITLMCDICSGIFLNWPIVSIITSICLLTLITIQLVQYLYYKNFFTNRNIVDQIILEK